MPIFELVLGSAAIIVVSILAGELFRRLMRTLAHQRGSESAVVRFLGRFGQGVILLFGIVAVVQFTGLGSEFELLSLAGVAGLVLALYLDDLVKELIAAYVLIREDVLRENDQVMIRDVKGRVLRVTARCTYIKTESGDLVVVANSFLHRGPFVNFTAKERMKDKEWFSEKT